MLLFVFRSWSRGREKGKHADRKLTDWMSPPAGSVCVDMCVCVQSARLHRVLASLLWSSQRRGCVQFCSPGLFAGGPEVALQIEPNWQELINGTVFVYRCGTFFRLVSLWILTFTLDAGALFSRVFSCCSSSNIIVQIISGVCFNLHGSSAEQGDTKLTHYKKIYSPHCKKHLQCVHIARPLKQSKRESAVSVLKCHSSQIYTSVCSFASSRMC